MPNSRTFTVDVTKDHLVFSAAHFITIGTDLCERLHGHNWRVAAQVQGTLDENCYVFDFIALRDTLQKQVDQLDHRTLLPTNHPQIRVEVVDCEVIVKYDSRRWIFPRDECVLLPIQQTTAELLAQWIGEQLLNELQLNETLLQNITQLTIKVEENFGQWAGCIFGLNEM